MYKLYFLGIPEYFSFKVRESEGGGTGRQVPRDSLRFPLSRFDLVLVFMDTANAERDELMADFVLNGNQAGDKRKYSE